MAAPIVYDGVAGQGGRSGSLFQGLKFWVAFRVPMRNAVVRKIETNGGQIVPLEKRADILIADHARKDAPPGAYSWKLIDDAVKNGNMGDKEDYLINRVVVSSRPAGSSEPGKATRTPFTAADDEILWRWTSKHERQGNSLKGNAIWPDLARMYPHHTWQSWRDRWMKKLSVMERPQHLLSPEEDLPGSAPPEQTVSIPASTPKPATAAQASPAKSSGGGGGRGLKFTEEDDKIVLAAIAEAAQHGRPLRGNVIYKELADIYPHHSYHSWRDRALRLLAKRDAQTIEEGQPDGSTSGPSYSTPTRSRVSDNVKETPPLRKAAPDSNAAPPNSKVKESPVKDNSLSDDNTLAAIVQRAFEDKMISLQANIRGFLVRNVLFTEPIESSASDKSEDSVNFPRVPVMSKEQFRRDIQEYLDVTKRTMNFWPDIGGRAIPLWDLFRTVTEQETDPQNRDWEKVAENLGIDWIAHANAPVELKQFFEENLGDFERLLLQFEDEDDEDDVEDFEGESNGSGRNALPHQDDKQTSRWTAPSETHLPSLPPHIAGQKRSAPSSLILSDPAYPSETSRKRRRMDPSSEIPSTPDDKIGASGMRRLAESGSSKLKGKATDSPSSKHLPSLPERRRRFFEPETQDFGYDPETQAYPTIENEDEPDITPSQQLQSESPTIAAIPLSLPNPQPVPFKRRTQARREIDSSVDRTIQEELGSSPAPESIATKPSPSAMRATRRSLPNTFKPVTEPASRRQNGHALSEGPRNGTQIGQIPNSDSPVQPVESAAASDSFQGTVEHFMSLGYPEKLVLTALKSTSLKQGYPTTVVLEKLQKGEGIPEYHEGVWTAKDDESLRYIISYEKLMEEGSAQHGGVVDDERKMRRKVERENKRLTVKHGQEGIELRRKYFKMWDGE